MAPASAFAPTSKETAVVAPPSTLPFASLSAIASAKTLARRSACSASRMWRAASAISSGVRVTQTPSALRIWPAGHCGTTQCCVTSFNVTASRS